MLNVERAEHVRVAMTFPRLAAWPRGHAGGRGGDVGDAAVVTRQAGHGTTAGYLQGRLRARTANRVLQGRATQCDDELNALLARAVVRRVRDRARRTDCNVVSLTLSNKSRRPAHNGQQIH